MECPQCKASFDSVCVIESRQRERYIRRRRKCTKCYHLFTTIEVLPDPAMLTEEGKLKWDGDYAIVNLKALGRIKSLMDTIVQAAQHASEELDARDTEES